MRRVLVLRPEPGASATVERAQQRGLKAVAVPLFEVEPIDWKTPDPDRFDALLLTSANAVRHGGDGLKVLRGMPVHAIGAATADAAREAGFTIVGIGDAGVDRLLGSLDPDLRLLHLTGEDRIALASARQALTVVPVYRAREVPNPALQSVQGSVALIHSPRAGRRFAELVQDRGSVIIAAISRAAAEAVGAGWASVEATESPNDDALLALAARLCNNLPGR